MFKQTLVIYCRNDNSPWLKTIIWVTGVVKDWELLFVTDVSKTCGEAIVRVKWTLEQCHLTLKTASTQVIKMSVTNKSPSQDSNHPDDHFQSRYVATGFKPFSYQVT